MLTAAAAFAALAGAASAAGPGPTLVRQASSVGVSLPLREVAARAPAFVPSPHPSVWERVNERNPKGERRRPGRSTDAALQLAAPATTAMPAPSVNFAGMSASNNTAIFGGGSPIPPDPNGDVGPNHYVQMVNTLVGVYSKTGTPLTPFFAISDLFASVGSALRRDRRRRSHRPVRPAGGPLAARRSSASRRRPAREHELSRSRRRADPTGTYFVYDFILPNDKVQRLSEIRRLARRVLHDQQPVLRGQHFAGGGAFAFDGTKMLAGDPTAAYIYFDEGVIDPDVCGQLPTDLDGVTLPPAGTPNLFIDFRADEFGDPADALRIFEFHADFANPGRLDVHGAARRAARGVRSARQRGTATRSRSRRPRPAANSWTRSRAR